MANELDNICIKKTTDRKICLLLKYFVRPQDRTESEMSNVINSVFTIQMLEMAKFLMDDCWRNLRFLKIR